MDARRARTVVACAVAAMCSMATPLTAHHSVLGFETTAGITLRGVVKAVQWDNPHARIAIEVSDGTGRGRWLVESESPLVLQRLGWTRSTLRTGDHVTVTGAAARSGERLMRCRSVARAGSPALSCYPGTTQ